MEQLLQMLIQIEDLLEQVQQITENQRNILIQQETEDAGVEMLEEMAKYKETITVQIEQVEEKFQGLYMKLKESIVGTEHAKEVKGHVQSILAVKEKVVKLEEENVRLLRERLKVHAKPIHVAPMANQVAAAYKVNDMYKNGNK